MIIDKIVIPIRLKLTLPSNMQLNSNRSIHFKLLSIVNVEQLDRHTFRPH